VDLVDEQHVVPFEVGQDRGQVLRFFQHRPRGLTQVHAEFGRDDVAECRLAQTGRAEQQHVVQRLLALARRPDEDFELLARLGLAHILIQVLGPQRALERIFAARRHRRAHHALGRLRLERRGRSGTAPLAGRRRVEVVGLDAHTVIIDGDGLPIPWS